VPAYGVSEPQRVDRAERGGRVVFTLNALPKRAIAIDAAPDGAGCIATAKIMIGGTAAALTSVFVQLRWPFGVDHLELTGRAIPDGRMLRERLADLGRATSHARSRGPAGGRANSVHPARSRGHDARTAWREVYGRRGRETTRELELPPGRRPANSPRDRDGRRLHRP
jgi:hypothetical protein